MKIGIEIDFKRGSGSIYWKSIGWRQVLRLSIAVSSLFVAGNLIANRLDSPVTQTNTHTTMPAQTLPAARAIPHPDTGRISRC